MTLRNIKIVLGLLISGWVLVISSSLAWAIDIREVKSPGGIKAWLVEDYTLPIIAVSFSFEGGSSQDEPGKEGTTRLLSALLDEGAGELKSQEFLGKLEENGISLGFSASRHQFSGTLRMVRDDMDEAFSLLGLALNEPRFDATPIERMRNAIRKSIVRSNSNPSGKRSEALRSLLFEDHAYSRPVRGTESSIEAITRDDLLAMKKRLLARDRVTIGVVGAISESELGEYLDKVFGSLDAGPELKKVAETEPLFGKSKNVKMDVPNASISVVYKGVKRKDEDFFAAHLMNHILGGGTFSSRLWDEVREKRGLTYHVGSSMITNRHAAYIMAATETRAENQDQTLKIIRDEISRMAESGPTQEELERTKKYIIGSYAINNLDTSLSIASVLNTLQFEDLGIDYIDKRQSYIESVTLEDTKRMARELLSVEPTIVIVGPKAE